MLEAAMRAKILTVPSMSIDPAAIAFIYDSLIIILGVVPELTREWNPDIAPHAMVMNR